MSTYILACILFLCLAPILLTRHNIHNIIIRIYSLSPRRQVLMSNVYYVYVLYKYITTISHYETRIEMNALSHYTPAIITNKNNNNRKKTVAVPLTACRHNNSAVQVSDAVRTCCSSCYV